MSNVNTTFSQVTKQLARINDNKAHRGLIVENVSLPVVSFKDTKGNRLEGTFAHGGSCLSLIINGTRYDLRQEMAFSDIRSALTAEGMQGISGVKSPAVSLAKAEDIVKATTKNTGKKKSSTSK